MKSGMYCIAREFSYAKWIHFMIFCRAFKQYSVTRYFTRFCRTVSFKTLQNGTDNQPTCVVHHDDIPSNVRCQRFTSGWRIWKRTHGHVHVQRSRVFGAAAVEWSSILRLFVPRKFHGFIHGRVQLARVERHRTHHAGTYAIHVRRQ